MHGREMSEGAINAIYRMIDPQLQDASSVLVTVCTKARSSSVESEGSVASGRIQRTEPALISPTCFLSMLTKHHSEALDRLIVSISTPLATEMGQRLYPHSRPID